MNELVNRLLGRDWGQVLLTSSFGLILLAFIGAPRAVSEIVGLAVQATFDRGAALILALVAIPIGLLARNLREAGILLTLGFVGLSISAPNLNGDAEELGQTLIGLALFLTLLAATTRCAKDFYQLAKQGQSIESSDSQADEANSKDKPWRKLGAAFAVILLTAVVGNYIAGRGFDKYATDEAAEAGAEAAEAGAEAGAEAAPAGAEAAAASGLPYFGASSSTEVDASIPDYGPIGTMNFHDSIPQYRTSFDCSKASAYVEKEICSNEYLAKQDIALSASFKKRIALLTGGRRAAFLAVERKKLGDRAACTTTTCIISWYSKNLSVAKTAEVSDEMAKLLEGASTATVEQNDIE